MPEFLWPRTFSDGEFFLIGPPSAAARTTLDLDSAYVYNTTGDAYADIFLFENGGTLDGVWVHVDAFTGTWENTDGVIDIELRELDSTQRRPGTLVTNGTTTLTLTAGTTGWYKATFGTPPSVSADGHAYSIVVGDEDGNGTDYVTMSRNTNGQAIGGQGGNRIAFTTDGFLTAPATVTGMTCINALVDGTMYGNVYVQSSSRPSTTLMIGCRVKFPFDVELVGPSIPGNSGFLDDPAEFKLFLASDDDPTSPIKTFTKFHANLGNAGLVHAVFDKDDRVVLLAGVEYYFVIDKNVNITIPKVFNTIISGDTNTIDADQKKLFPLNGEVYDVVEDVGGTSWNTDDEAVSAVGMFARPLIHQSQQGISRGLG